MRLLWIALAFGFAAPGVAQEIVTFPAEDGLTVTADLYEGGRPVIVAFHQANASRGEYKTIAPRLVDRGYTVLAVDQRAGRRFLGVENETYARAKAKGLRTTYASALPDMRGALRYARQMAGEEEPVIAWGSSYSASLVIYLAGYSPDLIDGFLAFSPGEYFKGRPNIMGAAERAKQPAFLTGSRKETEQWRAFFTALPNRLDKAGFVPDGEGAHGASALILRRSDSVTDYWRAVDRFLQSEFPSDLYKQQLLESR